LLSWRRWPVKFRPMHWKSPSCRSPRRKPPVRGLI